LILPSQISIIIPTYNEVDNLPPLLRYIKEVAPGVGEIIVVDSKESSDGTLESIKDDSVIQVKSTHSSRALQMQEGSKIAKGDVLYFLHADTTPPRTFINDILVSLEKGNEFGMFSYEFKSDSSLLKVNSKFTKRKGMFCGGGDQGLYILRSTFNQIGGFNTELPIMEDFELFWRLKDQKIPFEVIPSNAIVSARKYENNSYWKVNWVNMITMIKFKKGESPHKIKEFYTRKLQS
jgi:rSAM/selenodomain-associated transferase 2